MVIFTGAETKIMLNSQKARFKRSKVDLIVDRALYSIFALEIILCTLGSVLYYLWLVIIVY
jgi:phospholipid-transporting ATPase